MKILNRIALGLSLAMLAAPGATLAQKQIDEYGTEWQWNGGTIEVTSPEREPGQKSVLGLALPAMDSVRVGFVGLGMRGPGAVERFTYIPGIEIKALCDYEKERADDCQKYLRDASMPEADAQRLLGPRGPQRAHAEALHDSGELLLRLV